MYDDENPNGNYHKGSEFFVQAGIVCIGVWFKFYSMGWIQILGGILIW